MDRPGRAGLDDVGAAGLLEGGLASAQTQESLAKDLRNPVASLITHPLQSNFDFGLGSRDHGFRYTLNIQPVVPISLTEHWNVISRTIPPMIHQDGTSFPARAAASGWETRPRASTSRPSGPAHGG